jgi:hypothetical protein
MGADYSGTLSALHTSHALSHCIFKNAHYSMKLFYYEEVSLDDV